MVVGGKEGSGSIPGKVDRQKNSDPGRDKVHTVDKGMGRDMLPVDKARLAQRRDLNYSEFEFRSRGSLRRPLVAAWRSLGWDHAEGMARDTEMAPADYVIHREAYAGRMVDTQGE